MHTFHWNQYWVLSNTKAKKQGTRLNLIKFNPISSSTLKSYVIEPKSKPFKKKWKRKCVWPHGVNSYTLRDNECVGEAKTLQNCWIIGYPKPFFPFVSCFGFLAVVRIFFALSICSDEWWVLIPSIMNSAFNYLVENMLIDSNNKNGCLPNFLIIILVLDNRGWMRIDMDYR